MQVAFQSLRSGEAAFPRSSQGQAWFRGAECGRLAALVTHFRRRRGPAEDGLAGLVQHRALCKEASESSTGGGAYWRDAGLPSLYPTSLRATPRGSPTLPFKWSPP